MAAQLFVGSLSRDTQERDLENVFFKHGKLLRCDLKRGKSLPLEFSIGMNSLIYRLA